MDDREMLSVHCEKHGYKESSAAWNGNNVAVITRSMKTSACITMGHVLLS